MTLSLTIMRLIHFHSYSISIFSNSSLFAVLRYFFQFLPSDNIPEGAYSKHDICTAMKTIFEKGAIRERAIRRGTNGIIMICNNIIRVLGILLLI